MHVRLALQAYKGETLGARLSSAEKPLESQRHDDYFAALI
jgi:hypothetical protein